MSEIELLKLLSKSVKHTVKEFTNHIFTDPSKLMIASNLSLADVDKKIEELEKSKTRGRK